ncbi:HAMP domain-containing sensor histidine kinase [Pusillimonas sp. SM2304]|uniref:sensor histidine kinase n=1 Tax=Pusillimonas sp. SM2304 TaxID=3073241 RepID=UPI00287676EA|nr:HAMP domain-containing sensor histidine kinase [Pusillimonas sp. SM2304]MDS1139451.1 HAMP domain-containing sensor histidine kinase [Pusillimonas sp. SM2304]
MKWFRRIPLLVRIPLLSAIMIFAIAMLVTQIAVFSLSKQYEQLTERVGQVYLDGLSASVLPAYRKNDSEGIDRALRQSLDFYLGIVDRQLVLIDEDVGIMAHVSGPNLEATTPPPDAISLASKGYFYEPESQSMWVWRELGESGIIAANLDLSEYAQKRSALHLQLVLIGALMSIVAAFVGYIVIRRMQRPLRTINEHLSNAVAFGPQEIEESHIPKDDEETSTLMQAYNRMTTAVQDRERLSEQLAKQDQQALLGRIAATLAHELRNPLAGMMTALQTIRMYGENDRIRGEALDFIDRGVQSLQGVAEATLKAYRPSAPGPDLESRDLHDVLLLVDPHAARKRVNAAHHLSPFSSVKLDAFKIRQIALNLLLNAIQSSPAGGTVALEASYRDNVFTMKVSDEGEGLPQHVRNFLLAGDAVLSDRSLGLEIVRRLTQDMKGEIAVYNQGGRGSTIELRFPLTEIDTQ